MSQKIKQKLAERILNDESLTDELDDEDADTLINWGLAQIEALSDRATVSFSPGVPAEKTLEAQAEHIRRVMKHINRLVGKRNLLTTEELEEQLGRLREMVIGLRPAEPDAPGAGDLSDPARSSREVMARLLHGVSLQPPEDI